VSQLFTGADRTGCDPVYKLAVFSRYKGAIEYILESVLPIYFAWGNCGRVWFGRMGFEFLSGGCPSA
jgi:hypothetical protein